MFSRFQKSLQGTILKPLEIWFFHLCYLGSQDTLQSNHHGNKTFHDVQDLLEDFEGKSNLSSCQSEILESQRIIKKVRMARIRNIFKTSEEDASISMRNDPWSYNRSISMVRMQCVNIDIKKLTYFSKLLQKLMAIKCHWRKEKR